MIKRAHKYKAQRVNRVGFSFASKLEGALFDYLKFLELAGDVTNIRVQPHVKLTKAQITMIPDFVVFNNKEQIDHWYEAKGYQTDVYRIKRRLWQHYGPGALFVYGGSAKSLKLIEMIIPKGE